jgi:hypothetical protein
MIDIFGFTTKVINTEYVTYTNFNTVIIGVLSILAIIGVPTMNSIFKRFDKTDRRFDKTDDTINDLKLQMMRIETMLSLSLLRDGIDFKQQEEAIAEAQAKLNQTNQPNK